MNTSKSTYRLILTLAMMLLGISASFAAGINLSVEMPRGKQAIGVGDIFWIRYTVSDIDAAISKPAAVPGCHINYFQQTGSSSSYSNVNGQVTQSHSVIYTLTLRAEKEGSYSFGPVSAGSVKSNKVTFKIGPAGSGTPGAPQQNQRQQDPRAARQQDDQPKYIGHGDGQLFLKASVSKTTAYEQEALIYTVKLYTTYDGIRFIGAAAAPKFQGFAIEESKDVSQSLTFETYNGKSYATAVIARYVIFPQMTGHLKVIGNKYTVSVDEREYYHDPFWGNLSVSKPIQLNVSPNDLTVDVKPLPSPRPDNFSGAVGRFSITAAIPTSGWKTNIPVQVKYTVTGSGNLKYINLPDLSTVYPAEFETYQPTSDVKASAHTDGYKGSVTFEYSVMPQRTGSYTIPRLPLVYFNPTTGRYETAYAPSADIKVAEGVASARSQSKGNSSFNSSLLPVTSLKKEHSSYPSDPTYWLWYAIPALALSATLIYHRRRIAANADLVALRRRTAGKMAAKRLRKAKKAMNAGHTTQFYHEVLTALWGYLSHKLNIPQSDLSRDNVVKSIESLSLPQSDVDHLISIIDDCEFAQYAPPSELPPMAEVYGRASDAINNIETISRKAK